MRVADDAGDAGVRGGIVDDVVVRVVELAAEEGHLVVTARAPARRVHLAVAVHRHLSRLADAEQVGRIVERAELVGRVQVVVIDVLVALGAVFIHHERFGRDEVAIGGARLGREEVLHPFRRSFLAELLWIDGMDRGHAADDDRDGPRPVFAVFPFDLRAGLAMRDVREHGQHGHDQVREISNCTAHGAGRQLRHVLDLDQG